MNIAMKVSEQRFNLPLSIVLWKVVVAVRLKMINRYVKAGEKYSLSGYGLLYWQDPSTWHSNFLKYFFKVSLFLGNELELISWSALFSLFWYFSVFVYISFMQITSTCSFSVSHNLSFAHSYLLRRRISWVMWFWSKNMAVGTFELY